MSKRNIKFFYPNFFSNKLIAYVCLSLAENMRSDLFEVSVMGIASTKDARASFYKDAIPPFFISAVYRLFSNEQLKKFAEYRFMKSAMEGDVVYLWPDSSVSLFKSLKQKGCIVFRENINTHNAYAKKILDSEYGSLGLKNYKGISKKKIAREMEIQKYTDFVFSPSPMVTQSLRENGVSPESILPASYGLRKNEILECTVRNYNDNDYVTFIFVGSICIRKGIHLLLNAWTEANINGRLVLIGSIDESIKELVNNNISETITHIPFVDNLKDTYAKADVFILPSLEEGSPLVTYLALGAGIPSIVSPMGGGGVIDVTEGITIDPHNKTALIDAIKVLATNGKLRKSMGKSALSKATEYTWNNVAKKRAKLIEEELKLLDA